jgi:hypothetical protein
MIQNLEYIDEPLLEFGYGQRLKDPKGGLFLFGPLAERRPAQMRVGVVGQLGGLALYKEWLGKAQRFIPAVEPETPHHLAFPGFEAVFQTSWPILPIIEIPVQRQRSQTPSGRLIVITLSMKPWGCSSIPSSGGLRRTIWASTSGLWSFPTRSGGLDVRCRGPGALRSKTLAHSERGSHDVSCANHRYSLRTWRGLRPTNTT